MLGMVQLGRGNDAAQGDAQILPSMEQCALSMAQRESTNDAVAKDAQIKLNVKECARDMQSTMYISTAPVLDG